MMLVAGTLCAARHWRDYGYVAALARDWRVISVDRVDRATVWGYSRGGWLACNLASRHADRVNRIVVAAYAMNAHEEEGARLMAVLACFLRDGDWAAVWQALGVFDRGFQRMMEESNDALAVAAAIDGSLRPTRFVDPASIHCPATYYVGSEDWIVPYVRADVDALGATLDVIDGQGHIGSFFASADPVLTAMTARLMH